MRKLDDEHIGGKLLLLAGNILITALLTVGSALSRLSVDFLPRHPQLDLGAVLAVCIAASAASAVLLTWKHGLWADLALLAAGGLFLWRLREKLLEGWPLDRPPWISDLIGKYPAALYLLCAMLALAMALIVVRTRQWYLAAALSIGLVLSPILEGTLPMWGAMLCAFSGWGTMLLTSLFSRKDPEGLGRAQLLNLAGMWALILLLVMALPMEGYTRPKWATDARTSLIRGVTARLERFMDTKALEAGIFAELGLDLSIPSEGGSIAVSGPAGTGTGSSDSAGTGMRQRENLLAAGPRRYSGRTVMTVSTDQPSPAGWMYLRGGTFGEYTGSSWEDGRIPDFAGPEQFPPLTAPDAPSCTLQVRDIGFQGVWYCPYRYDGEEMMDGNGWLTLEQDRGLGDLLGISAPEERRTEEYRIPYRPGGPEDGFVPLEDSQAERLESYRNDPYFALSYLAVSLELWDYLEPLVEEIQREPAVLDPRLPEQFREPVAAAARTASYLASVADYDVNTPAMERGEDFVTHFLEEGRGYCVHFATAGAMLLRRQNIPARYVTGYVVDLNGQGRGAVRDSDAHAWVEIYLDGYGWYPVEMTPGYSGGAGDVTLSGAPEAPEPEEPVQPDPPEEEGPNQPGEEPEEAPPLPGGESPDGEAPEEASFVFPWRAALKAVLVLGALAGGYALSFLPRRLERQDPDTNRSAISAYRRCRRVVGMGGAEDETLEALGRKAKFSQHTLTEEERKTAWARLEAAREQLLARRTGWRKLLVRLLGPLL